MEETAAAEAAMAGSASEQPRPKRRSPRDTFAQVRAKERVRVAEYQEALAQRLIDGPSPDADVIYRHNQHDAVSAKEHAVMLRAVAGSIRADLCDPHRLWPKVVDQELPL